VDYSKSDNETGGRMAGKMKIINVLPLDEMEKHEKTENCKCHPRVESIGASGKVIIHKLFDGNEIFRIDVDEKRWSNPKFLTT
jgi:hypothetical protein